MGGRYDPTGIHGGDRACPAGRSPATTFRGPRSETLAIIAYRQPIGRRRSRRSGRRRWRNPQVLHERGLFDINGGAKAWDGRSSTERRRRSSSSFALRPSRASPRADELAIACRAPRQATPTSVLHQGNGEAPPRAIDARINADSTRAARAGSPLVAEQKNLSPRGRVRINGAVAETGQSVDPSRDSITVDGKAVGAPVALSWVVLNKPTGVLTTRSDPGGRRTVFELVADVPGLTYVGRLDYMTEGVLLLTTDGDAAHKLTHPSHEIERTYLATVRGEGADAARAAMKGVKLEDGMVMPREFLAVESARHSGSSISRSPKERREK